MQKSIITIVEIHGTRAVLLSRFTKNIYFLDFTSVVTLVITRTLRIVLYDQPGHYGYPEALSDSK